MHITAGSQGKAILQAIDTYLAEANVDAHYSWQARKGYIAEVNLNRQHSWQARKGYVASNRHIPCGSESKCGAQLAARKGYVWT